MSVRGIIIGFLALASGVSAMALVYLLKMPQAGPAIERVDVVYAAAEIKPGEAIAATMLEVRKVPKEEAPEDALHDISEAVDRAAFYQIDQGDVLRRKKLAEKGAGRGMAALIRPGMRAFTIQTPSFSSSLAGFLLPGNRVDVLLTINNGLPSQEDAGGGSTTTLLQNVEILAVHTTVNTPTNNKIDPNDARSVTLLVTPEDASLLDFGQNKGTLHLSLRNAKDSVNSKPKFTTLADLQLPRPRVQTSVNHMVTRTLRGTLAGYDSTTFVTTTTNDDASTTRGGRSASLDRTEPPLTPRH